MKLIKSPNKFYCGPCSLAMLLDTSVDSILDRLGHTGLEIVRPNIPEPDCRRGFHIQEFIDVALQYDFALVEIESSPISYLADFKYIYEVPLDHETRITEYMNKYSGLIIGEYALGRGHMCAWNHLDQKIYDPQGTVYSFDDDQHKITINSFCAAIRIKSDS